MNTTRKIHIISYLPHRVVYKFISGLEKVTEPRLRFEKKLKEGFYEVLNPQSIPNRV